MSKKICFIGHRKIPSYYNIENKLKIAIQNELDLGCRHFIMGSHGEFDNLALNICRQFRQKYNDIQIEVVITSLNQIKKEIIKDDIFGDEIYIPYQDVKTIMYQIEEEYFKTQIISSNKHMINSCDKMICCVDTKRYTSGAKIALKYAKKSNLDIINLYDEKNEPTFGMSQEQKEQYYNDWLQEMQNINHKK